ncbi:hypothetical protein [Streptomyces sp. NPDC096193]|uniref:hypothetical protein n=1 Tax=Streptomyces sp. NPDC096193 TaxID=3155821 RepID=UPI00331FAE00
METAVIAVIGTLLGSLITHVFQRQTTERAAQLARSEQLRQDRISAYSAFAGALVDTGAGGTTAGTVHGRPRTARPPRRPASTRTGSVRAPIRR